MKNKLVHLTLAAVSIATFAHSGMGVVAADGGNAGAVYTLTNAASGNGVTVFSRAGDGTLTATGTVLTGGLGSDAGLGSQGALALSDDNEWLFAVNARSNEISIWAVRPNGLTLVDKVASRRVLPIRVTDYQDLVYVPNAGSSGNISGFRLGQHSKLMPLPDSTRSLNNGGVGVASHVTTHASAGQTPFGFDYSPGGRLAVSEAFGGAVNASAASSYNVSDHRFAAVSASAPTGQTAARWLVVTRNSKFAYTANAGGDSVSLYRLNPDGGMTLINGREGEPGTGSHPTDMALSHNSQYLYVLDAFRLNLSAFAVQADGCLSPIAGANGLAPSMAGLATW